MLKQRPDARKSDLQRTRRLTDTHVSGALVESFESLVPSLHLPDADDRRATAAAIRAKAEFLVTWNLKDFPAPILSSYSIRPLSPDFFLCELLEQSGPEVVKALAAKRHRLRKPAQTSGQFLETLARQKLTRFVAALEPFKEQL